MSGREAVTGQAATDTKWGATDTKWGATDTKWGTGRPAREGSV
jgi:hypothetical protein